MTLANAWILHFLWAVPFIAFALIMQYRRRQRAMDRFADPSLLKKLTSEDHKGKRFLKALMLLFAVGVLILALAGPRWGNRYQEVSRKGVDIMMLVDVSRSMMVEDIKPNRLERATREIIDFLKVVEGDRVGLTAFSGTAFVQCPLTLDYAALEMFLNVLEPGIIPVPGTDLGAAIETGLTAFDAKTETDKVMLLITDGEDNENRGLEVARMAAEQGIKIFVFGIGDPSGGPIPAGNDQGGFKKDKSGNLVLSKLDEKTLQNIAAVTGGGYVRSIAGDLDLDILYFDGIKKKTEAQTLKSGKIKVYEERFHVFILVAFLLLLFEEMLDDKRRKNSKRWYPFFMSVLTVGLIPLIISSPAVAAESPDELYRQGRYEEAEKAYAQNDMDHPKDIRFRYNRGCAAYQNGKYEEAVAAFSSVIRRTQDKNVHFKAAFNLGNTAFKQGDYTAAAMYYKQALVDQPANEDARFNLELALRALRKEQDKREQSDTSSQGKNQQQQETQGSPDSGESSPDQESPKSQEAKDAQQEDENGQEASDQVAEDDEKSQASTRDKQSETKDEESLTGDLKPREAMAELEQNDLTQSEAAPDTDKNKAEALLDNIREDPSQILRYMMSEEDRHGKFSGRDW